MYLRTHWPGFTTLTNLCADESAGKRRWMRKIRGSKNHTGSNQAVFSAVSINSMLRLLPAIKKAISRFIKASPG
jgi:hypothetical protein